jgi:hypothetical protein
MAATIPYMSDLPIHGAPAAAAVEPQSAMSLAEPGLR